MHVDRVDLPVQRVGDLDLDAEAVQQLDERGVLALERGGVGQRQPAPSQSPAVAGRRTSTRRSGATIEVTPKRAPDGADAVMSRILPPVAARRTAGRRCA